MIAGYLIWKYGLSHLDALNMIRVKRGFIDPNIGFVGQLMSLEQRLVSKKMNQSLIESFTVNL